MRALAVTELKGALDGEAPAIASLLGVSVYDVKTRLLGALPRVILQTTDDALVDAVEAGLVARGHRVVTCDVAAVVPSGAMVRLHRFRLDADGVWANDAPGPGAGDATYDPASDRLLWRDVGAIVVAQVRATVARTTEEVETVRRPGRPPRTEKRDVVRHEHALSHAAYLFPRQGAPSSCPWVLEEVTAQYLSLGPAMQPTRRANFFTTVARFRDLAPNAIVDDRFVTQPLAPPASLNVRSGDAIPVAALSAGADLTVHLLAHWLMRRRGGPYRG